MHFAKHETFYIRDGWLQKGLRAVSANSGIFLDESAPAQLGLGKNMVRSLRYWMQIAGLTYEEQSRSTKVQRLTEFGNLVLSHDLYQEREDTLWIIHHNLLSNPALATSWYWFFNHFAPNSFTRQGFVERIHQWLVTQVADDSELPASSSILKDFDCIIHTYCPRGRQISPEDTLESPLVVLGLMREVEQNDDDLRKTRHYRLQSPMPDVISPFALLYTLLKRQEHERPGARQVSLNDALRAPMSAGRTFNIGLGVLEEVMRRLENLDERVAVRLVRTGGLDQITLPAISSREALELCYQHAESDEDLKSWPLHLN
jgi:hypothetical protein